MMKETPNPPTGMFGSPMTFLVTQPYDSEGEEPENQAVLNHRTVDSSQELLCTERNTQGHYSFCGEL